MQVIDRLHGASNTAYFNRKYAAKKGSDVSREELNRLVIDRETLHDGGSCDEQILAASDLIDALLVMLFTEEGVLKNERN
jgi:hypothetical protein